MSIDELFSRSASSPAEHPAGRSDLPDDGVFRVVQAVGQHILKAEQYNERKAVKILLPEGELPPVLEFRTPTVIAGDLVCRTLRVDGNLSVKGEYRPARDGEEKESVN